MIITSIYTHLFRRNGNYYLYNSRSNFFSQISEELYSAIKDAQWHQLPADVLTTLQEKEIIIESTSQYDFYNSEYLRFMARCYDNTQMSLIIAPTTACNFACPYCFEPKKNPKTISDEVIEKTVEFVTSNKSLKELYITWYGGEPLLAFDQITKLYEKLKALDTPELKSQTIITNGYHFNDDVISFFKETGLERIQITLDGIKSRHDKLRCVKNTLEPTYDIILRNINSILKELPDTHLDIRVNINKDNFRDFIELHKYFTAQNGNNRMLSVYPGIIREETSDKCSLCPQSFAPCEMTDLYRLFREEGLNTSVFPRKHMRGCMMQMLNAYIIGPEGELYKCWNDVSDSEKVIGNLSEVDLKRSSMYINYMTQTVPFNDECKNCSVFPICDGGCSLLRYRNIFENGRFDLCSPLKELRNLENALFNGEIKIE